MNKLNGIEDALIDVQEIRTDEKLQSVIDKARQSNKSIMIWQNRGSQIHRTVNNLYRDIDVPVFDLSGRTLITNDVDLLDILPVYTPENKVADPGKAGIIVVDEFTWMDPVLMNVFINLAAYGKHTDWTLYPGWIFVFLCNISESAFEKYDNLDFKCTSHIKNYTYCPRHRSDDELDDVNESLNEEDKVHTKLREIYEHLCNCQDIAESIGYMSLMYDFEELRHRMDNIIFRGEKSLNI